MLKFTKIMNVGVIFVQWKKYLKRYIVFYWYNIESSAFFSVAWQCLLLVCGVNYLSTNIQYITYRCVVGCKSGFWGTEVGWGPVWLCLVSGDWDRVDGHTVWTVTACDGHSVCWRAHRVDGHTVLTVTPCWRSHRVDGHSVWTVTQCWRSHRVDGHTVLMVTPCWRSHSVDGHTVWTVTPCGWSHRVDGHTVLTVTPCWRSHRVCGHTMLTVTHRVDGHSA